MIGHEWTRIASFRHRGSKGTEGLLLLARGHTRHDMPCQTSDDVSLVGRKVQPLDHQRDDGHERVSIEEAEWGRAVTAATKVGRFIQGHWSSVIGLPQCFRDVVPVGGWFVQRILRLTKHRVLCRHKIPSERGQLILDSRHDLLGGRFFGFLDPLQFLHSFALQKAFACVGIDRFRNKAFLHRQAFRHQFPEERIFKQLRINRRFHGGGITLCPAFCNAPRG